MNGELGSLICLHKLTRFSLKCQQVPTGEQHLANLLKISMSVYPNCFCISPYALFY